MENIDIYAQPLKLSLNGHYKLKTGIGGYLTILTLILMIFYGWLQVKELYVKESPNIYNQIFTQEKANILTFNKDYSPFYFQIFNLNQSMFINPSVLNIKLKIKSIVNLRTQNITIIDLNYCQKKHFPYNQNISKQEQNSYDLIIKNRYLCPELKENLNIFGSYIEGNMTIIQIIVYPCQNSTDDVVCKSKKEIDQLIWNNRLYLSFYYPLLSINLNDYSNPITYNLKEDYYYLPETNNYKFYTYGIDDLLIRSDAGYINANFWEKSGNIINLISNDVWNIDDKDPYFFSIDLISTFNKNIYTRSYIKVFDIISICGGLFNSIRLLFLYLTNFLFHFEVTRVMMNNIFAFKDPSNSEEEEIEI